MDSIHLRIRIDRAIAEKAMEMAHAHSMELPDVVRMMLTKAVRIGDFSIDEERPKYRVTEPSRPYFAYDERQWDSLKIVLDAELALALVNQYIASHALQIEALTDQDPEKAAEIAQLKQEHDEARQILATLDPSDTDAIRAILARFGPPGDPEGSGGEGSQQ
jgi:hypothetical protein